MVTIWKDIKGFENYQVSSDGFVRNKITGKFLKQRQRKENGHLSVDLYKNSKKKGVLVHVLIMENFIGEVEGLEVCHDELNTNNIYHMRYDTRLENSLDKYRHGISKNATSKLDYQDAWHIRMLYTHKIYNQRELGNIYEVSESNINRLIRRETFNFVDDNGNIKPSTTGIYYNRLMEIKYRGKAYQLAQNLNMTVQLDDNILDYVTFEKVIL